MSVNASELKRFRAEKDRVFARDPHSPLPPAERPAFRGLAYFDENPALIVAVGIDRDVEPGEVVMSTTGGEEQVYRRYGLVRFRVDDQPAQLTLYSSEDSDELFVPFRHATSAHETYGTGRYLEVEAHGRHGTSDFNYVTNPHLPPYPS